MYNQGVISPHGWKSVLERFHPELCLLDFLLWNDPINGLWVGNPHQNDTKNRSGGKIQLFKGNFPISKRVFTKNVNIS